MNLRLIVHGPHHVARDVVIVDGSPIPARRRDFGLMTDDVGVVDDGNRFRSAGQILDVETSLGASRHRRKTFPMDFQATAKTLQH